MPFWCMQSIQDVLENEFHGCIDIAYEGVGSSLQAYAWNSLRPNGRLLVVGYISEYPHTLTTDIRSEHEQQSTLPPSDVLFWQGVTHTEGDKVAYGNVWPSDQTLRASALQKAYTLHEKGEVIPLVDKKRVFQGVDAISDAVDYMLSGNALGKVCCKLA